MEINSEHPLDRFQNQTESNQICTHLKPAPIKPPSTRTLQRAPVHVCTGIYTGARSATKGNNLAVL